MLSEDSRCGVRVSRWDEPPVFPAIVHQPTCENNRFVFPVPTSSFSPKENQSRFPAGGHREDFDMDPSFPYHIKEDAIGGKPDDPEQLYAETSPKCVYEETVPKRVEGEHDSRHEQGERLQGHAHGEMESTYPCAETCPKFVYDETYPKRAYSGTESDLDRTGVHDQSPFTMSFPDSEPRFSYSSVDSGDYPYPLDEDPVSPESPGQFSTYGSPSSKATMDPFPEEDSSDAEPKDPELARPQQGARPAYRRHPSAEQPPCLAHRRVHRPGTRRFSDTSGSSAGAPSAPTSAQQRRYQQMRATGRSRSEETGDEFSQQLLEEQAQLVADAAGGISISSDMRGVQTHVRESSNVHVGPKVFDQRAFRVERMESRVENLHRHEHVENKHEHIQTKHEHIQSKTEVHNKTENVKHEHIQEKHEHIQVHKTEILHSKADAIYTNQLHVHIDCRRDSPPPPSPLAIRDISCVSAAGSAEEPPRSPARPFADCRRYLETRYTSWTTLSTPLPWYDDMVLDLSKSCVDFSMVSMGSSSTNTYNGVEELVRGQQVDKALRIIVEGHAGYGKTTLAAKVAFDWANGASYLQRYNHAFLISLRELTGPLDAHIKAHHYPLELADSANAFLEYLKTNQDGVLFIFDGYDELPKEGRETIDQIMSGRAFVHSGAILTSRPMAMTFKKYCQFVSLIGFDDSKKREFVRLVYKDRPMMRIDEFLQVLETDRSVDELAQCPLMCLLLCEMHQRGAFAGRATKSKLYEELFHYLKGKAVHRRQQHYLADEQRRLLASYDEDMVKFGEFCLHCLAKDKLSFTVEEIRKVCEAQRLFEIGFLVQCRNLTSYIGSETYYEPIHKTFVEFLSARYLRSIASDEDNLKKGLMELKQTTGRASERLVLQYLCGLLKTEAWNIMEQLDIDDANQEFVFSLLHEAGETPQNVAAVCRRLPRDKVVIRGSDRHLSTWALCLSSPASEVSDIEFIWEFESSRTRDTPDEFVSAQLGFWSALQSCANVTDLRITFVYGHSNEVPAGFLDALCECMKHCARLARLAVLHVRAIAPDSAAETFLPVISSLAQYVPSCASLHQLTVEMNLSSEMTKSLCSGLSYVGRLQTLKLPRLYCDAAGFAELARLVRHHVSLKYLDVAVVLIDGPIDLSNLSYNQLNRQAMGRNRQVSTSPRTIRKVPLHRAMRRAHPEAEEERPRIGPDQELQSLQTVLAINFKDERRVRVVDGIWCLADQAGARALYPLPMCDRMSHKGGYHALFEVMRLPGARLESLTVGRESLTKMDYVCLGETIRKSESLTQLTVRGVEKGMNMFPVLGALPTARRLESISLRSHLIQLNDFLFMVLCRCLEHNPTLREIDISQWRLLLEAPSSVDHLRNLMKNTGLKRAQLTECKVKLAYRVEEPLLACSAVTDLNLSNCTVETPAGMVRGAAFLPHLQGMSQLKHLDLSHKSAPPLNDAAVKSFFAGLSGFKNMQELAICSWTYEVANPEAAYTDTKNSAKKCGRLTTVLIEKSQFSPRSAECSRQWLVQAIATGVPHLQELRLSGLMQTEPRQCAFTRSQVESLAKAVLKAKWTGSALYLYMQQVDGRLVDMFVELTRVSPKIEVTSDGRRIMFKRNSVNPQWWRLRPR